MRRTLTLTACTAALLGISAPGISAPVAAADPSPAPGSVAYMIGRCYDPSQPVTERPATVEYICDSTSIMENMTWTSWGPDGANGTGTDNSLECQPDCAQGPRLINPIVVHAWNPKAPITTGCPPDVQFYSDLTVAYPKGVPPWIKPGTSWSNTVDYITIDGMPAVHFTNQGPRSCTPLPQ